VEAALPTSTNPIDTFAFIRAIRGFKNGHSFKPELPLVLKTFLPNTEKIDSLYIIDFFIKECFLKQIFSICFIAVLTLIGGFANAQEGFSGPGPDIVSIDAAKNLKDDYPVILRGRIERFLGDEKYLFTDKTGSIIVEIDNKLWRGLSIDQNDPIEITGEADRGFTMMEIEASSIKKL
jgi:uncharacterized protein (TIGR00156 family)